MLRVLILLLVNLWSITRGTMRKIIQALPWSKDNDRRYVKIKIPPGVQLSGPPRKIGPLKLGSKGPGAWWAFEKLIARIEKDDAVEGVYFKAENTRISLAEMHEVAALLDRLKRAGKRVVCHMDQAMTGDYLLATSADTVMMSPPGRLYTFGLRADMLSLGGLLEKAGITAQFVNLGRYKTASHRFTRKSMSSHQMVMTRQLIHGMERSIAERISERRDVDPAQATSIFHEAPVSARDARRQGLIDEMLYADQVKDALEAQSRCKRKVKLIAAAQYQKTPSSKIVLKPLRRQHANLAVLDLRGMIMHDSPSATQRALTPRPVLKALRALQKNDKIKALVLRIDSPGGSALASDLIWRELVEFGKQKPVIASLGNVAASGGYYIAAAAHEIVAHPETITGSIGVIAGKLSGGDLLDKLGVRVDGVKPHKTSNFSNLFAPLSEDEVQNLRRDIRAFYRRFLQRVSADRKIPVRKLHRLARGRVYMGERALRLGLVDHLGGLEKAIQLACQKADLPREKAKISFVNHQPNPLKALMKTGEASASFQGENFSPRAGRTLLEEALPEELRPALDVLSLMREGSAMALCPWSLQRAPQ